MADVGTVVSSAGVAGTPLVIPTTFAGSNRGLLVFIGRSSAVITVDSVTCDGVALTELGTVNSSNNAVVGNLWALESEPDAGTLDVVVTCSTSGVDDFGVIAVPLVDVLQSDRFGTPATGLDGGAATASISATVPSESGDLILAALLIALDAGTPRHTSGGGQTELEYVGNFNGDSLAVDSKAGASTSTAMSWTIDPASRSAIIGVAVHDAAAAGDTTPPTLSNASATSTGSTTAAGSVDTDEGNGTLYYVVTTSSTAPSAAQVQAGQDHTGAAAADSGSQAVSGTGTQNVTGGFTGLTASTTYYAHYQQQDAATNDSTVLTSASFQTDAPPDLAPVVEITAPAGNITVSAGTTIVVTATSTDAVDGDLSSSIEWTSSNTDDGTSGALGTGASVQIDTTGWSEDSRTITATSTDSNEGTGTDSFTLTIGAAPEPTDNPYLLARAKAAALGGF